MFKMTSVNFQALLLAANSLLTNFHQVFAGMAALDSSASCLICCSAAAALLMYTESFS
jgi:hypothetical protein